MHKSLPALIGLACSAALWLGVAQFATSALAQCIGDCNEDGMVTVDDVITMAAIDGPPSEIGEKVGAALVGTFLGILLCYGFVGPMGTKLEHFVNEEGHYLQCIKTGVLAVYKGFPPAIAVEFARRVIPGDVRPSFDETEKACKARPEKDKEAAAAAAA